MNSLVIRQEMIRRGLTQDDIAVVCNITPLSAGKIIRGETKLSRGLHVIKLAEYLRVSPTILLENKTEIDRRKLLEFVLGRIGYTSMFDYYIYNPYARLKLKDFKHLINYYEVDVSTLALAPGWKNELKMDKGKVIDYICDKNLNYEGIFNNIEKACDRYSSLRIFANDYLKCGLRNIMDFLVEKNPDELSSFFSYTFTYLLDIKGLSMEELSRRIGYPLTEIFNLQIGRISEVKHLNIIKGIAEELHCEMKNFFTPSYLK